MSPFRTDTEYCRLRDLYETAKAEGNHDLRDTYALAVVVRGDELLAKMGGSVRFAPLMEALDAMDASEDD